jgi:hypothetical protein
VRLFEANSPRTREPSAWTRPVHACETTISSFRRVPQLASRVRRRARASCAFERAAALHADRSRNEGETGRDRTVDHAETSRIREALMDGMTETKAPTDPIKLTREHLGEIEKIWVGFAKAKLEPYLEKSKAWMKKQKKEPAPPAPTT